MSKIKRRNGNDPFEYTPGSIIKKKKEKLIKSNSSIVHCWYRMKVVISFVYFFFILGKKMSSPMKRLSVICMRKDNMK
jgi:hypothetical protein